MAELTIANLKSTPCIYQSSRAVFDVLIGEDAALPLIEALSSDDNTKLHSMLKQPQWIEIALSEPHFDNEHPVRSVTAMPMLTLTRAIIIAARDGHAAAISTLLGFASEQGMKPMTVITSWAIDRAIINGHAAVFEAMASVDRKVVTFPLGHGNLPLIQSVRRGRTEVVAVLLRHGAKPPASNEFSYASSLLYWSTTARGPRMTELLLKHGASVTCSGALQSASRRGALDSMRLLIQHGADVNEILPEDTLARYFRPLFPNWTPMHFAASTGRVDAMKLLESNGARSDVKDRNGKTPAQLLEEYKNAHTDV
ncbi:ankyrin repeat-containing protein [Rutstroemia sp. NJR-2017a WRK4]|nr:ankyrin repeat-containing protein [Rutstroemia sp. NJR-2017a WRK4]